MFTGLIQDIGRVRSIARKGDWRIVIETTMSADHMQNGASICCSGCCLTVVESGKGWFAVQASAETLSKTSVKEWTEGSLINLEPSLRLGDALGGHFVFGHIDAVAALKHIEKQGESFILEIEIPHNLAHFTAPKGSVALDGVSLTVNQVKDNRFWVNIIPHSWEKTALHTKKPGDALNFEADMLARYVARILDKAAA